MAVIQISKIQVRSGLNENLPQLDTGELGWSVDTRQLYVGNGTAGEGSPEPGGVTEVLTIYSPIGAALSNVYILEEEIAAVQANVANLQNTSTGTVSYITLSDAATNANANLTLSNSDTHTIDYNIIRGIAVRVGSIKVAQLFGNVFYEDDYSENTSTGVTLGFYCNVNVATLTYTTTSTGTPATFGYYLKSYVN